MTEQRGPTIATGGKDSPFLSIALSTGRRRMTGWMPPRPELAGRKGLNPRVTRLWSLRAHASDPALKLAKRLVHEGQTVVDVGADLGVYSSNFAALVGPSGRVHAFEPNPARHALLAALANAQPNVEVHPIALSDHEGEEALHVPIKQGEVVSACGRLSPPPASASGVSWERRLVKVNTLDRELLAESSRSASSSATSRVTNTRCFVAQSKGCERRCRCC